MISCVENTLHHSASFTVCVEPCCVCQLQVSLHREKVTWPGAMIKKPGEGMPNYDDNTRRGSLFITVDVDFPRGTFSDEDKEGGCAPIIIL